MKTLKRILSITACTMALSAPVGAEGPGTGELTKHNIQIGDCVADSITVRWDLDSLMGEAVVKGSYHYSSSDPTCKPHYRTVIWLRLEGLGGFGYVRLSPAIPDRPGQWGYNTPGAPPWDGALCGYRDTQRAECLPGNNAKKVWKHGRVTDFDVVW